MGTFDDGDGDDEKDDHDQDDHDDDATIDSRVRWCSVRIDVVERVLLTLAEQSTKLLL
jgi:hypothetical protein